MSFVKNIKEKLLHYEWDIAYGPYQESIIYKGIDWEQLHIVKNPYVGKWFADPFILAEDEERLTLLVEEFDKKVNKGRIARIEINKSTDIIEECHIVLECSTHLSFPSIYKIDDRVYVNPENCRSGEGHLYEYNFEKDLLESPICIVNEAVSDAVIYYENNVYNLSATCDPSPNGCILRRYQSNSLRGPFMFQEERYFPNNSARMAGQYINTSKGVIRPAQDCNGGYGNAVILYEGEHVINVLKPLSKKYAGLHTFNVRKSTYVIDLKRYDYPMIYNVRCKWKAL